jgi:hypothetical protein
MGLGHSVFNSRGCSPQPPEHAAPTSHCISGTAQQESHALLDCMTDGPHRRRVKHVRARLREWVRVQTGVLEVSLVDGRHARGRRQMGVDWWLERAARRAQSVEDLFAATTASAVSNKFVGGVERAKHPLPARRTRFRRPGAPSQALQNPLPSAYGTSPSRPSWCLERFHTAKQLPRQAVVESR